MKKTKLNLEKRNLLQENQDLQSQIAKLKLQFEKALTVNDLLEEAYKQNSELNKQLHKCDAEREELLKRLDIANKNCAELEYRLLIEQKMRNSEQINDRENIKNQKYQEKLKEIQQKLENTQQNLEKSEQLNITMENEIKQACASASSYFGQNISSLNFLIPYFYKQRGPTQEDFDCTISKVSSKIKKWKKKYYNENQLRIDESRKSITAQQNAANSTIEDLRKTNNNLKKKVDELQLLHDQVVSENSHNVAQIKILQMKLCDYERNEHDNSNDNLSKFGNEISTLRVQNAKLNDKLNDCKHLYRQAENSLSTFKKQCQNLEASLQSAENKLIISEQAKLELEQKLKKTQNKQRKFESDAIKTNILIEKQKKQIQKLMADLELKRSATLRIEESLSEIKSELDNSNIEKKELRARLEEQSNEIFRNQKNASLLADQLQKTESSLKTIKKVPIASTKIPQIPVSAFVCSEMPEDLAEHLKKISKSNSESSISNRITEVLSETISYYKNIQNQQKEEMKNELEKYNQLEKSFNSCVDFLAHRFDIGIDFKKLDEIPTRDCFSEFLANEKSRFEDLKVQLEWSQQFIARIMSLIGAQEPDEIVGIITKLLKSYEKKLNTIKSIQGKFAEYKNISSNEIESLQNLNEEMQEKLDTKSDEIMSLKEEIKKCSEDNLSLNQTILNKEREVEEAKAKYETNIKEINNNLMSVESKVDKLIKEKESLEREKESLKKEIDQSRQEFDLLSEELKQTESDNKLLTESINRLKRKGKKDLKKQKMAWKEMEGRFMDQIRQHREESERAVLELKREIEKKDAQISEMKSTIEESALRLRRQEMTAKAAARDAQRAMQQAESKSAARVLAAESNVRVQKEKYDNLVATVSAGLSSFMEPGEKFDPDNAELSLSRIREKIGHVSFMQSFQ